MLIDITNHQINKTQGTNEAYQQRNKKKKKKKKKGTSPFQRVKKLAMDLQGHAFFKRHVTTEIQSWKFRNRIQCALN